MEACNRNLGDWYGKVKRGEIKLPRFQRFEAWDRQRICSLLEMVIRNLPLGITLVLDVGDEEQFISRYLETAPQKTNRVTEHLLDGQQRLTALWRAFHNNYEGETYYIYLREFDRTDGEADRDDCSVFCRTRYYQKNGLRYPLWCDNPALCLERGMIPTDLLCPEDRQQEIDDWIEAATRSMEPDEGKEELRKFYDFKKRVSDRIKDLRATLANYNLPYLSLPADTDKTIALNVFINMNTNSKPLSQYDIIVAEVESVMGQSLHDLETDLGRKYPEVALYAPLSSQILTTSALLQGTLPNQRGAWEMNKKRMVENWETMAEGLHRMARFLRGEGIYDEQRLPTNAVLAVIAALYAYIPESGDKRGQDELLLRKYLWHAFFTDRYENAAASRAFADFNGLKRILTGERKEDGSPYGIGDVPIFADHALVDVEELMSAEWPKRATIRGRGVLAVACRLGALDFSTGERLDAGTIGQRHYHHIYPDALLKEAGITSFLAVNCALIADTTNIAIGRKDPLQYLMDRYAWTSETIVRERLQSHLIPIEELANGGYEGLSDAEKNEKLKADFEGFVRRRAWLILRAAKHLADGRQLSAREVYEE
ncbi:MAG: DUF262 domain-containing protein [Methanofollis sp.]|uniref:DUF262 domain-containing protein n=1 Tax=Methanofollis sp. TaxID=2052835 RepID=UPI0026129600|nr:DUF262 domain-containing protein [Methanofollis sp.]MDD4254885.1 DUF262 domain-containing protein [Methanofollis sp.]